MPARRNPINEVHIWPVRLYLEDLQEIDAVVRSFPERKVSLSVEDYQLDSIEELGEIRKSMLKSVRWSTLSDLVVRADKTGATVVATGNDTQLRGAAEQIADVFRKRRRSGYRVFILSSLLAAGGLSPFVILTVVSSSLWIIPFFICLAWIGAGGRGRLSQGAQIIAVRREDRPSFWERKRDEIVLLLIGAVGGPS